MWSTMPSGVLRQGLLYSPEWPGTHYVDHTGLELTDHLPLPPPEC